MSQKIDWTTIKFSESVEQPIGVWIDGKTVYRKVISSDWIDDGSTQLKATGISFSSIVQANGVCCWEDGATVVPAMWVSNYTSSSYGLRTDFYFDKSTGNIDFRNRTGRKSKFIIVVEYTKT